MPLSSNFYIAKRGNVIRDRVWGLAHRCDRHRCHTRGCRHACRADRSDPNAIFNEERLTKAAVRYAQGLKDGIDEDDLVARELGKSSAKEMKGDSVLEKYQEPLKRKISQRAREIQKDNDDSNLLFVAGRQGFKTGDYHQATLLFTEALKQQVGGGNSRLGGDIQLWLGLAYQATGRELEAIELFKEVHQSHPVATVRKQAGNLKYILEAPKLKQGRDEFVTLPLLSPAAKPLRRNSSKTRASRIPPKRRVSEEDLKRLNDKFWEDLPLPSAIKNRTSALLIGLLAALAAVASVVFRESL